MTQYTPSDEDLKRFWSKVDKTGGDDACWEWTATLTSGRYGSIRWGGRMRRAHRVSWSIENGPIPEGMHICHSCDNEKCVNPNHLWLGTHQENMIDRDAKHRRKAPAGEHSKSSKLSRDQVKQIRKMYSTGNYTQRQIANQFAMSQYAIWRIVNHVGWK